MTPESSTVPRTQPSIECCLVNEWMDEWIAQGLDKQTDKYGLQSSEWGVRRTAQGILKAGPVFCWVSKPLRFLWRKGSWNICHPQLFEPCFSHLCNVAHHISSPGWLRRVNELEHVISSFNTVKHSISVSHHEWWQYYYFKVKGGGAGRRQEQRS